ncbi:Hypothetical protein CINCED_3A024088 [Cinara cedri]|uniref:Uncharacterized protein n=1 Tax=Cinara cedri TaxID=506608 RepID=A0A5E4MCP5_9HEMI|nr:Hypothetical protein CINCED_3A024088 [Cinara cedri]
MVKYTHSGYKTWLPDIRRIVTARDIVFDEPIEYCNEHDQEEDTQVTWTNEEHKNKETDYTSHIACASPYLKLYSSWKYYATQFRISHHSKSH